MKIGIHQVAEAAKVSTTTVSEVLSGTGRYAPATIKRVRAAVQKLQYRPSRRARAMQAGRNHCLTVVADIPADRDSPYQAMIVAGVALAAKRVGYSVELVQMLGREDAREFLEDTDGVLTSSTVREEVVRRIAESGLPLVRVNPGVCGASDCVGPDDAGGAAAVGRLIRERGYNRVLFVGGDRVLHASVRIRLEALAAAVRGLDFHRVCVTPGAAGEVLKEFCADARGRTAIVDYADNVIFGLLVAGTRMGLECPRDFGLASCHMRHDEILEEAGLDLCGAVHCIQAMGHAGGRMLIEKIQNGNRSMPSVILSETVHEGNSLRSAER
jgi:LacI family transcriptional regulator